jgi:hypothetical protein
VLGYGDGKTCGISIKTAPVEGASLIDFEDAIGCRSGHGPEHRDEATITGEFAKPGHGLVLLRGLAGMIHSPAFK